MKTATLSGLLSLVALLMSGAQLPETPPPGPLPDTMTPTPAVSVLPANPKLVASFESEQGFGSERIALFDDGMVAHVVTFRQRSTTNRVTVTTNERDLLKAVCVEALELPDDEALRTPVLPEGGRRFRLEITRPDGKSRVFVFGELTPLPLAIGRARGALDDLRARFIKREVPEERLWDPATVVTDQRLRRRADGKWFFVVRDDLFERNLELKEEGNGLERLFLGRDELTRLFEKPKEPAPEQEPERR